MTHYTKIELQNDISQCLPSCEKNIIPPAKRLFDTLKLWRHRSIERKQLARVNARLLNDVGLTRCDAEKEAAKPFWVK